MLRTWWYGVRKIGLGLGGYDITVMWAMRKTRDCSGFVCPIYGPLRRDDREELGLEFREFGFRD